jgi:hypothetical protein
MPQNQPFEMPKQLRELAEVNVEQAPCGLRPIRGRHDASDECVVDRSFERDDVWTQGRPGVGDPVCQGEY